MTRALLGLAIGLGLASVLGGPAAGQDLPLPGVEDAGAPVIEEESSTRELHLLRSPPATRETFLVAMNDLWSDPGADYYQVWCNEFGPSSLDVLLYMFFEVPDWNTELRERGGIELDDAGNPIEAPPSGDPEETTS